MPYVQIRRKSLIQKAWDFEPKTLGEHIRRRRLMLSLEQKEVAAILGVDPMTVHNWETGHRKPEISFIPALVQFLGYDPEPVVDTGTLAGRLAVKRRQLELSQERHIWDTHNSDFSDSRISTSLSASAFGLRNTEA